MFASVLFFILYAVCPTVKSQVTCSSGVACNVDCSDASTTCGTSKTIDATAATSLSVLCNEAYSCDRTKIYIPNATDASTTIACSDDSCGYTEVYYLGDATATPSTHSLSVICSGANDGCNFMEIYASNAGQFELQCDDVRCQSMDIFVENVDTVTMQCDAPTSYADGCKSIDLHATNANTVTILCNGDTGCYGNIITATNADKLYVTAQPNGIYQGEYHAENIGSIFEITCIGDGTSDPGCSGGSGFYIPQNDADLNKFTLNCYGTGCYNIKLFKTVGGFANIANANINWNGCLQCPGDIDDCVQYIYTYCGASTSDYFPYQTACGTTLDCPNCPVVYNAFYDAFTDDSSDSLCLLPSGTIPCAPDSACNIDCSAQACAGNIVDGSQASSLTVSCLTVDSCKDTVIYPTTKVSSSSEITCSGGGATTRYESGCNGAFTIHGNDASSLTVIGTPYGIGAGSIYAQSIANSFTLTCIGNGTEPYKQHACDELKVYLPDTASELSKFTMNCYGTGCADIRFYHENGFADMGSADINFNGCLQCADASYPDRDAGYTCLGSIYTYCDTSYSSNDYFGTTASDGFDCGLSPKCNCDVVANAFESSYTDDTSDANCMIHAGIQCSGNAVCTVDCSTQSCAGEVIDASLATGLTMQCTVAEKCKDAMVALPTDIASETNIICGALDACHGLRLTFSGDASSNPEDHKISLHCNTVDDACDGVIINADKAGTVQMFCDGVQCADTTIIANHANIVKVSCIGPETTADGYNKYGCKTIVINATDVATSVDVSCSGSSGCYGAKLYANRAASVVLDLNGAASSSQKFFYGQQSDSFSITCYAGFDSQDTAFAGCKNANFYAPDTITATNFKLNCYGKGCDGMNVYSANGFGTATADNFYVNGCTDCELNVVETGTTYCMDDLGLGCIDATQSTTSHVTFDFDGIGCSVEQSNDCGCAHAATLLNAVFTNDVPSDSDSCSASLFAYEYDAPEEEDDPTTTVIILIILLLLFCLVAGLIRKCWLKNEWEKRKKVKDKLAVEIAAGDTTKQTEYDEICVNTPDEFLEPKLKDWTEYGLYYAVDPFFSLFYDRWDKYFAYIGWAGEAIEVFVTLWIIFSLLSPKAAFACCSYSRENARCDPYQAMGEDLSLVDVDENGWCVVDGTPCVRSYYYDADDASAMFECFGAENEAIAKKWNGAVCGADARKEEVAANSTWIVVVLLFKLIKIGWDYYITILQFQEKKRVAKENLQLVAEYRAKHPNWKPDTEKAPEYEEEAAAAKKDETAEPEKELETEDAVQQKESDPVPKDEAGAPTEEKERKEDGAGGTGPKLISEEAIKVFGFISTEDEHWKKCYPYFVMVMFFLGSTLSVAVLAGLDATGGISIADCSYDDGDWESACYNVGKCAYAGEQQSDTSSSGTSYESVYAIINNNVQLEGPQVVAIFATVIAYIAYVPMIREKVTKYMVSKGLKQGEVEADELMDLEAWNGLF